MQTIAEAHHNNDDFKHVVEKGEQQSVGRN